MRRILGLIAALSLLQIAAPALAQNNVSAKVVVACGTPGQTPVVGSSYTITQDTTLTLCTTAGGGGGSNASVGTNGAAAPTSSTQIGILVGANLQPVSATNPVPISGSITASNAAVGATGSAAPASASYGGLLNGSNLIGALGDSAGRTIVAGGGTAGTPAGGVVSVQGVASGTALPVSGTFWQTTQPVSGTVTANAGSGTFAVSAASLPLPTGAATAAKQPALGTAGVSSTDVISVQGIASGTAMPISGTVTANAGTNLNTSALATSANLTSGTQKTQIVDGSGNVIASTSNNLNVQCANCSGSGVSTADQASFTAGTSLFAGSGGFYQTTATSNPLTTGQQGVFQVTANRALFSNLRNAAGTEVGTSTTPLQVSLANTAANATAVKVDGSAVTQPVSGTFWQATQPVSGTVSITANSAVNEAQINGVTPLMGNGVTGTGSQRVTIASDNTAFTVNAAESGTWNITNVSGTVSLPTGASTETTLAKLTQAQGSTTSGQSGPLVQGAVTTGAPTYTTAQTAPLSLDTAGNLRTVTSLAANSSVNVAQVNGVTTLTGNGVTGTGSQRVTIASDNTAFGVNAAQSGTWNITNVSGTVSLPTGASTETTLAKLAVAQGSTTSGQSGTLAVGAVTTGSPTYTTAQTSPLSLTTAGALRTDASATTQPVSGTVSITANSAVNVAQINGVTTTTGNGVSGTGVQRVTLASDSTGQVTLAAGANTIGALTANQSVNTAQVNGVTVLTGTGATGTGAQRVTVATDSATVAGSASIPAGTNLMGKVGLDQTTPGTTNGVQDASTSATGSAVPAKASFMGANSAGNLTGLIQADSSASVSISTATTTQIVALSSTKKIYVTAYSLIAGGTGNVTFEYGTGSNCGTGTTVLTGALPLVANSGIATGSGLGPVLVVPASNALCILTSAGVQISGSVAYTQF